MSSDQNVDVIVSVYGSNARAYLRVQSYRLS